MNIGQTAFLCFDCRFYSQALEALCFVAVLALVLAALVPALDLEH